MKHKEPDLRRDDGKTDDQADGDGECGAPVDKDFGTLEKVVEVLANRSRKPDPSPRVQLAMDMLVIAACERAERIFRSDLPPIGADAYV